MRARMASVRSLMAFKSPARAFLTIIFTVDHLSYKTIDMFSIKSARLTKPLNLISVKTSRFFYVF